MSNEQPLLSDVTSKVGLSFRHETGSSGAFYFPEITAGGCALFDMDNDGDLDAYLLQGFPLRSLLDDQGNRIRWAPLEARIGANRLFRNDLTTTSQGTAQLSFSDITEESGTGHQGYAMGCAVGDYDNDGDQDLFVSNFGPNCLLRNEGDGTFSDVTTSAIEADPRWNTSAAFFDYDRDGWLDLFVCCYVNYSLMENKPCYGDAGIRDYCGPQSFTPLPDRLYRNNGDGTFENATTRAGISRAFGSGLGVVTGDFNNDGWPDLYVANDGNANQLWINQRDGTFLNSALVAGAAFNGIGAPEAGMGVCAEDFDNDGDEDLFLTHLLRETNTLLVNDGTATFEDCTSGCNVGAPSMATTGFGVAWVDLNGDACRDLFIANGGVKIEAELTNSDFPYGQHNVLQLGADAANVSYQSVSDVAEQVLQPKETSRGCASGDLDNDGDLDLLITNANGPARVLRNNTDPRDTWISIQPRQKNSNRFALGSRILLDLDDGTTLYNRVRTDGSFCSASDVRIVAIVPRERVLKGVRIVWPDGVEENIGALSLGTQHILYRQPEVAEQ